MADRQGPDSLGADNTPVEVAPAADPMLSGRIRQTALVINGVHFLEVGMRVFMIVDHGGTVRSIALMSKTFQKS